jgi:hypothetical protein
MGVRSTRLIVLVVVSLFASLMLASSALAIGSLPLKQRDFTKIGDNGQLTLPDSGMNVYAWSMATLGDDLYVGTARQAAIAPVMELLGPTMGMLPNAAFDYTRVPPLVSFVATDTPAGQPPKLRSTPYGSFGLPLLMFGAWNSLSQAEILRFDHDTRTWTRVYQAPMVPTLMRDASGTSVVETDTPLAIGFRNMVAFDGHLYATAGSLSFAQQPLIGSGLISSLLFMSDEDGENWGPLNTPALMGLESRALGVHNGKLYVGVGTQTVGSLGGVIVPAGVWCSATPDVPGSWTNVLDFPTLESGLPLTEQNTGVISMASANGFLYIGTENQSGFEVWRSTVASPTGSTDWKCLVTGGAGDAYNVWAGTMKAFNTSVYVGSMAVPGMAASQSLKSFDIIRVLSPLCNDRVQLLVGNRTPTIPVNGVTKRTPLSGWQSGFGWPFDLYLWSMEVYQGRLYVGSMDMSSMLRVASENGADLSGMANAMGVPPFLFNVMLKGAGFDLWSTSNGIIWCNSSLTGMGDYTNYGARTMRVWDDQLVIGTANPFNGFQAWESTVAH